MQNMLDRVQFNLDYQFIQNRQDFTESTQHQIGSSISMAISIGLKNSNTLNFGTVSSCLDQNAFCFKNGELYKEFFIGGSYSLTNTLGISSKATLIKQISTIEKESLQFLIGSFLRI
jgi:hypothetical protein